MDCCLIVTLLMLLPGLLLAFPYTERPHTEGAPTEDPTALDMTSRILQANKGISDMLFEGDVTLPRTKNALKCLNNQCFWQKSPSGVVQVPYVISSDYQDTDKATIETAMQSFHEKTCIQFVPWSGQRDYISIESRFGCYSGVGRSGGKQVVSLATFGCVSHGVIEHELNHALGFYHEHTRSDRDQHVRINWENILEPVAYNFDINDANNLNTPYDYSSVMHYGRNAFSSNGKDTITPIPDASVQIGQRVALSAIDIMRINTLYNCKV